MNNLSTWLEHLIVSKEIPQIFAPSYQVKNCFIIKISLLRTIDFVFRENSDLPKNSNLHNTIIVQNVISLTSWGKKLVIVVSRYNFFSTCYSVITKYFISTPLLRSTLSQSSSILPIFLSSPRLNCFKKAWRSFWKEQLTGVQINFKLVWSFGVMIMVQTIYG